MKPTALEIEVAKVDRRWGWAIIQPKVLLAYSGGYRTKAGARADAEMFAAQLRVKPRRKVTT